MATMNVANTAYPTADLNEVVVLEYGDTFRLRDGALSIRVLSGAAWITSQEKDYVLETGGQLTIPRQPNAVIVSALDHQPLHFAYRKL